MNYNRKHLLLKKKSKQKAPSISLTFFSSSKFKYKYVPQSDFCRGKQMKIEEESMKSQTAIRCAKAAVLLSSLSNRNMKATINNKEDEEKETMESEIEDLKVELVRERMKTKKIKLCGLMEVVLEVMVVFFVSSFILMVFVFKFN